MLHSLKLLGNFGSLACAFVQILLVCKFTDLSDNNGSKFPIFHTETGKTGLFGKKNQLNPTLAASVPLDSGDKTTALPDP